MKIEVNISKKYLFIIIAVIVIAAAIVGVIASHGTSTPNPGHDLEEIGGIPTCGAGEVLTHTGTGLICVTDQTGGNPVDCQTLYWYNWQWDIAPSCPNNYVNVKTNCASSHGLTDPLCFRLCERQVCS